MELEQQYRALVERVRGYPMSEVARARILAEIEATYRRARAAKLGALLAQSPTKTCIADNTEQQAESFQHSGLVLRGFAHF